MAIKFEMNVPKTIQLTEFVETTVSEQYENTQHHYKALCEGMEDDVYMSDYLKDLVAKTGSNTVSIMKIMQASGKQGWNVTAVDPGSAAQPPQNAGSAAQPPQNAGGAPQNPQTPQTLPNVPTAPQSDSTGVWEPSAKDIVEARGKLLRRCFAEAYDIFWQTFTRVVTEEEGGNPDNPPINREDFDRYCTADSLERVAVHMSMDFNTSYIRSKLIERHQKEEAPAPEPQQPPQEDLPVIQVQQPEPDLPDYPVIDSQPDDDGEIPF